MKITVCKDEHAFDVAAAWRIIGQMLTKPDAVIGLSTGQTTKNMHAIVSDIYSRYPFDTSRITLLNVDELTNLPRSYAGCCYTMIREQIADPLGIPEERFIMPQTISDDYEAECRNFQALEDRGGIDLQMLGLATTATSASTSPGPPSAAKPWVSPMDPIFEARVRKETGVGPDHELGGLTLGVRTIMHAKHIILIAKGAHKAEMVEKDAPGPRHRGHPTSVPAAASQPRIPAGCRGCQICNGSCISRLKPAGYCFGAVPPAIFISPIKSSYLPQGAMPSMGKNLTSFLFPGFCF